MLFAHVGSVEAGLTLDVSPGNNARVGPDRGHWLKQEDVADGVPLSFAGLVPTIVFLDAAGLVWERVGNGEPERILSTADYLRKRQIAREAHWSKQDQAARRCRLVWKNEPWAGRAVRRVEPRCGT